MGFRFTQDGKLIIYKWTGVENRAIREAMRLSVRQFAERFGVSDRMISKWEGNGGALAPRPANQSALDMLLRLATPEVRARFGASLKAISEPPPEDGTPPRIQPPQRFEPAPAPEVRKIPTPPPPNGRVERPPPELWDDPRLADVLANRMIGEIYRYLQLVGYSQRYISRLTGQAQSEIPETLNGRRITSYDVIARIAEGLGIPRGRMGLAYDPPRPDPSPECPDVLINETSARHKATAKGPARGRAEISSPTRPLDREDVSTQ